MSKLKNDLEKKYPGTIIWTHWLSAIFITVLILASLNFPGFSSLNPGTLFLLHLGSGSLVFIFTIIRSISLLRKKQPAHLQTGSAFMDKLIVWNHWAMYFMIYMVSGMGIIAMVQGHGAPILKYHVLAAFIIVLLALMHIAGFIKHLIFAKENTLKRIF